MVYPNKHIDVLRLNRAIHSVCSSIILLRLGHNYIAIVIASAMNLTLPVSCSDRSALRYAFDGFEHVDKKFEQIKDAIQGGK